ncbi:hypothetical protein EV356DRAFT_531291 [Viridothelium virens]|uniref:Protein sip5 n=1 Tax=Viridothelium virens TaxID=1048519 RepID=A0A6A6HDG9_VIRVR|nr:hypothetical protein EV356DRAFT_531291 [Viridothelium virens]
MGNNPSKGERPSAGQDSRPGSARDVHSHPFGGPLPQSPSSDRPPPSSPGGRGTRPDLSSLLSFGAGHDRDAQQEVRRETKQEREARKLEKERIAREKERERSIREEGVDGGYLVTLGTYTGPEDFNKAVVRQLMIERRLAPFWKGLNDHSDSWTELQLVAAVRGRPIPAADEVPDDNPARAASRADSNPTSSQTNLNNLTMPITSRSPSYNSDASASLGLSHPAFSSLPPSSPLSSQSQSSNSPLFRGRAKTLASLTSKANNQSDMAPQEIQLPKDPYVNGQAIEAYLYKDASECPICFLYYPPYLNKTRCCDQPICSECFVQIKRPDPHPPEHHDPNNPDASIDTQNPEEDGQLVSEPAACPFCVQPEFGVTYEPPPFRRGLAYNAPPNHPLASATSAMSSSSSLSSGSALSPGTGSRRRATSLSATSPTVITTDRVRPDWAKKLADARAHALRRSAAATALHNAAYVLGNSNSVDLRTFGLTGRRRRTLFAAGDAPGGSGTASPREGGMPLGNMAALLAAADRQGNPSGPGRVDGPNSNDLFPGRVSSRATARRAEDIEELMMMEAIRLSLQAEEDRKRKEDKDARKEEKKERKQRKKDGKRLEKEMDRQKKQGGFFPLEVEGIEGGSSSVAGRNYIPQTETGSKGKAVDRGVTTVGYNPLNEPTSTVNTETLTTTNSKEEPQRHLELSRAQLANDSTIPSPGLAPPVESSNAPNLALEPTSSSSSSSSSASSSGLPAVEPVSIADPDNDDSIPLSAQLIEPVNTNDTQATTATSATTTAGDPITPALTNFSSLASAINTSKSSEQATEQVAETTANRSRGDSGESSGSSTAPPLPPQSLPEPEKTQVLIGNGDLAKTGGGNDHEGDHGIATNHVGDVSVREGQVTR